MDAKEIVISEVVKIMHLERSESERLKNVLVMALYPFTLIESAGTDLIPADGNKDMEAIRMFFIAKNVQGLTEKTLRYYKTVIEAALKFINKPLTEISTNDLRYYLAVKKTRDNNSDSNIDNIRRVLSSFFSWLVEEEYTSKNPVLKIKKVRVEKNVKKPFKDTEVERLRLEAAKDIRLTAILETMLSTGCRVSEISGINKADVEGDEVLVHGKGKKERIVYLNARARLAIERYLATRDDDKPYLFVGEFKPHNRLKISGIGLQIRELGRAAGVPDTHPHRFRRTAATMALNRGMPIEQVQIMLGHEQIETTTLYAVSAQETVKASHKKYVV